MAWGFPPALGAPSGPFSACSSSDSPSPRSEMRDPWRTPGLCASHPLPCPWGPFLCHDVNTHLFAGEAQITTLPHLPQKFNSRRLEWEVGGLCPGDAHTHLRCSRRVPGPPVFALRLSLPFLWLCRSSQHLPQTTWPSDPTISQVLWILHHK